MCGLVGLITGWGTGLYNAETDMFQQLLYIDVFRGADATGVALVHKDASVEILKEASSSDVFLKDKASVFLCNGAGRQTGKALLGHNRKSTIGADNDENAHPFVIDDRYVFFHNGTLKQHKKLHDTNVDSEALGMHLARCEGDKAKLEEALSHVDGAYACVWYDQDKHTVYMLRNKERPLVLARFENSGGFAYASEAWMLMGICSRNNQKVKSYDVLTEDVLYSIDLDINPLVVKEEILTIKKSSPQSHKQHRSSGQKAPGATTADDDEDLGELADGITKRFAKQIMSKYLASNTKIKFEIDDFIETQVGSKLPSHVRQDFMVWGTNKTQYPGVVFRGVIRDLSEDELIELGEDYVQATINYTEWSNKSKIVTAHVREIAASSIQTQNETPFIN